MAPYVLSFAFLAALLLPGAATASSSATKALELCQQADRLAGAEKRRVLRHGLEIADRAVATSPSDAKAHFAVFCNLGKEVHSRGVGLRDVATLGRLRRELDTALEIAPEYADALAAKGALLIKLPRLLGGDARQGEELLRQALENDPDNAEARRYLTEVAAPVGAGIGR